MRGVLAYDAPATMDLNNVEEVRLLLDFQQSPQQLEAVLKAEHDDKATTVRQIESAPINITDQMQAVLVSRLLPVLVGVVIGILFKIVLGIVARRRSSENNE